MSPDPALHPPFLLVRFIRAVFDAFSPFLQQDSPLYWPFILSTLIVAAVAWRLVLARREGHGAAWREFRRRYLSRALWWHPSARADYRYYFINAIVFPLAFGPAVFTGAHLAGAIDRLLAPLIGAAPSGTAGLGLRLVYTVMFFIAYDFGRFVAHCTLHDVPVLWEFHKVHHSAEVLTPMTGFRSHPLDLLVMAWGAALATGLATWAFQRLCGATITGYTFLELNVLLWGFGLFGNLKHWQVPISYGRRLDRWLISPAHHQIHHSAEPRHFGCNRGFEIALWDRLFGTLRLPLPGERFALGLGDGTEASWHRVGRLYFRPFALAARRLVRRHTGAPRPTTTAAG